VNDESRIIEQRRHPFGVGEVVITHTANSEAGRQKAIRRKIASLKALQVQRIELAEAMRRSLDLIIEKKQREIDNLEQQVTMRVVS
jgi:hypothetical protein